MKIVDRYWSAICWDCQHILHFSAHDYFKWESYAIHVGSQVFYKWRRKRPTSELLDFFDILMNIEGTKVNEQVLEDPETIEWMASQPERSSRPPIFGHTKEVNLMMMQIEVQTGKQMKRPIIPGLELKLTRKIIRTKDAVARAQERNRLKKAS
ncbi:MAG: hypothetical protein A4E20_10855 [Nitrospira sp. SG-bin2]|uniref:hypothetical protein n=1 Tax=Nitrospira cf. moscoviensis SBR1015 TaxID=96242 RepID=UPI000A0B1792|nr:hypothetical protein [Nitrospira cf. moscoviensis SBR1015]OQW34511.1 MAG: hypothetical protein A4E20_10855 [Nitrospira sp. SG-bin2]